MSESQAPRWMRRVLIAAGVYNLAWGGIAILWPRWAFAWAGLPQPNYPELWQCIGMMVGVYGVGYLLAARAPRQYWPLVLVGLLGKVCGPLGFLHSLGQGQLNWAFGLNLLFNDLLWWIPFTLILRDAWIYHHTNGPDSEPLATEATPSAPQAIPSRKILEYSAHR